MRRNGWVLIVALLAVGVLVALVFGGGVGPMIAGGMRRLQALSDVAPVATAALYVLAYAAFVFACLPAGPPMSMLGGALFGIWIGTACALVGIVVGSIGFFLLARTAFGAALGQRRSGVLRRIEPRLQRDGFATLLAMRIAPVMPSWLLSLGAALAGMRLRPFLVASALGVLPATLVFASTGAGLGRAVAEGGTPGLAVILRPGVLLPLLGLSALTLLPVIWRLVRAPR